MLFNSYIFILLFLPLCVSGYFLLNRFKKYTLAQGFLLLMSFWFYGYYSISYLFVILASILINYGIYVLIEKAGEKKLRKLVMIAGVALNIGILIYFKYMDFFIGNINAVFGSDIPFLKIALPLGISFFTFQQISFLVDAYRGEIPKYNFLHYACFVSYFPQLIAGPIVTHDELVPQFQDETKKKMNADNVAKGLYIFAIGLAKKVLLADTFGKIVSYGYTDVNELNTLTAIITMVAYTIQLYFDFSGYSDMAIGLGQMMNFDLPQNFNSPYKAITIADFWDRWHMTLTRFFTKYVYIPLGGSRKGLAKTCVNTFIVFLLSGLWHGSNWTFVLWGVMHGVFQILYRVFKKFFDKLPDLLNWMITFVFVNVAWVFFKAENFTQALTLLGKIGEWNFEGFDWNFVEVVRSIEIKEVLDIFSVETMFPPFVLVTLFVLAFAILLFGKNAYEKMLDFKPTVVNLISTIVLMLWSIFSFTGISTFLYFNF